MQSSALGWLIPGTVIQDFPCPAASLVIAALVPAITWDQTQLNKQPILTNGENYFRWNFSESRKDQEQNFRVKVLKVV